MSAQQKEGAAQMQLRASGTGPWPGDEPRQAASASFSALSAALPPVPLTATPARGGTRWAVDTIGFAAALLEGLPIDHDAHGWRLSSGAGRDLRVEASRRARTIEACEEYGAGFAHPMLLTLPGPWTLAAHLSLPSGAPVIGDSGAVRDLLQSYATGTSDVLNTMARALGVRPRVRLCEGVLDTVLRGSLPTASGLHTLPALPETGVIAGLRSYLRRTGEDTIVTVPRLSAVTVRGRALPHRELLAQAGVSSAAVPLSEAQDTRAWDELAAACDAGFELWLALPGEADSAHLGQWIDAIVSPWSRTGMSRSSASEFGVLGGWQIPLHNPPLLPAQASPPAALGSLELAHRIATALQEDA